MHDLKEGKKINRESTLYTLNPLLDENGVLRVGGRMEFTSLPSETKHPAILPGKEKFTELLIVNEHSKLFHNGVSHTLAGLRQRFWIPKGRQVVKKVLKRCLICKRYSATSAREITAQLPKERVLESPPFSVVGIDFCGPLYTTTKHNAEKAYVALFVCATTRAIHLELVTDLTTDTFLLSLRRFFARRGISKTIISDNAKTFKRAEKDLQQLWKAARNEEVQNYLSGNRICWRYITPLAPWCGGFYERLVRSVKTSLKKVLGKASINFQELSTLLCEIESVINSRPLTYTYNEAEEPEPLTPSHFLLSGDPYREPLPYEALIEQRSPQDLTKRLKYRQLITKRMWNRWRKQYLLELRSAQHLKIPNKSSNLRENDVVLIECKGTPKTLWKMGVITGLIRGRDGKVRSCFVRTNKTTFRRPISLLYPLEVQEGQ